MWDEGGTRNRTLISHPSSLPRKEPPVSAPYSVDGGSATLDCGDLSVRAINQAIRAAIAAGATGIHLLRPDARHNLGVGLPQGLTLTIEGSAGYYVAGLNDGAIVEIHGGAGWGAAESMRDGTIVI